MTEHFPSQFYEVDAALSLVEKSSEEIEERFAMEIGCIKDRPDPTGKSWRKLQDDQEKITNNSQKSLDYIAALVNAGKISPNLGMIAYGLIYIESELEGYKISVDNGFYQHFGSLSHFVSRNCLGIEIGLERTGLKPHHSVIVGFVKQRGSQIFEEAIKYAKGAIA